jgi:phosphosulfolactate phosphohydrolase-like enzyme
VSEAQKQSGYQVRFDWGSDGARAIADGADAVVWVDQLGTEAAPVAVGAAGVDVVTASLETAGEVAAWALARQTELGGRFTVAVVAAGVTRADGTLRFAVEDLLAAGAVIEAVSELGIDHQSPEAAAAASAYHGLQRGTRHLISASVTAREFADGDRRQR